MKHNKSIPLLSRLCMEHASPDIAQIAADYELSYGEAAGVLSFYSLANGLPAEERLEPMLMISGPLLDHAKYSKWLGLEKAKKQPDKIIHELEESSLSGRGGAAFPTAKKWLDVKNSSDEEKYIICNLSEGEPGTAKDLLLLTEYPEAIIEGMVISALATGAKKGYVYIRAGYSDGAEKLRSAIAENRDKLCGFEIEVIENLGAYVCGEETALIASLEGERGEPRKKPPYPTLHGLLGKPSLINNAESFACIPLILDLGGKAFRKNETRLFTVSGCGIEAAVCEMPLSSSVRDIISAAGGAEDMRAFQLGGGASGCIFPAEFADFSLSSAEAKTNGLTLGAGSIRLISHSDNIREICTEIMRFYVSESCGKCTPCRWGCAKLLRMLESPDSVGIRELAEHISSASSCALGKSAGNALLSAMACFPKEFECTQEKEDWI